MHELILHHYPQSPVAEKVRMVLGIKGLDWRSVEIPRIPPKPDLLPLTGGYRRTPVLQIGADVYCDSQCIVRHLEHHRPQPTLYPGGAAGMVWGVSRWTDGPLFKAAIALVLGAADELPQAFAEDRGRLYFGAGFDLPTLQRSVPETLAQLRGQLGWMDQRLSGDRNFMLGAAPGLPDVLTYYVVWFIRGRYSEGPAFLSQFGSLVDWEQRMQSIGHGQPSEMSAAEALQVAKSATPATVEQADPGDPQGLAPAMAVAVVPEGDGGDPPVRGEIVSVSAETIAIRRSDQRVGEVVVHFPRVGYNVSAL